MLQEGNWRRDKLFSISRGEHNSPALDHQPRREQSACGIHKYREATQYVQRVKQFNNIRADHSALQKAID